MGSILSEVRGESLNRSVTGLVRVLIKDAVKEALYEYETEGGKRSMETETSSEMFEERGGSTGSDEGRGLLPVLLLTGTLVLASYALRRRVDSPGEAVEIATERIRTGAEETGERADEATSQAAERTEAVAGDVADRVEETGEEAADRIDETGDEASDRVEMGGHEAADEMESAAEKMEEDDSGENENED